MVYNGIKVFDNKGFGLRAIGCRASGGWARRDDECHSNRLS